MSSVPIEILHHVVEQVLADELEIILSLKLFKKWLVAKTLSVIDLFFSRRDLHGQAALLAGVLFKSSAASILFGQPVDESVFNHSLIIAILDKIFALPHQALPLRWVRCSYQSVVNLVEIVVVSPPLVHLLIPIKFILL